MKVRSTRRTRTLVTQMVRWAGRQRDLSVMYEMVGGVEVAQGDLAAALKSYLDSLAIMQRLAQSDPGNLGWQSELSACKSMAYIGNPAAISLQAFGGSAQLVRVAWITRRSCRCRINGKNGTWTERLGRRSARKKGDNSSVVR